MQHVDEAEVRRIARLARLEITDAEAESLKGEINAILQWVDELNRIDTTGVEPMTSVVAMTLKERRDEVTDGGIAADIVKNAPAAEDNYFVVPKVVE
jgi:aspartyl-tRNA(Asn)/glutamyl-tRNA(Gln) amidotransferase subunit C